MTIIYVLKSENDEYHRIHGATLSLATAEGWVEDMKARQQTLNEAQHVLNAGMAKWNEANPVPSTTPPSPSKLKQLHKIPRKDRTPEILAQIEAAKAEMDRLQDCAMQPLRAWYTAQGEEIARLKATFPEQIQHDFEDLPAYDDFSFDTTILY
jgi:hypothetical protein